jgi:hypothetical protein
MAMDAVDNLNYKPGLVVIKDVGGRAQVRAWKKRKRK